ncbi:MAG TPA: RHS repeat-associated core domain-containing protein, partial [Bacteroidia bacterium]|nr:RHS repeat-associated core domain-containing protein [Bacteroidia bacterium]
MTYPFGSVTPGRSFSSGSYRYGFNKQEKDDEVFGSNVYDFGARIYDARLARWWALDKLKDRYAPISPYTFGLDNPNYFVDHAGKIIIDKNGNTVVLTRDDKGNITGISATNSKGEKVDADPFTVKMITAVGKTDIGRERLKQMEVHSDQFQYKRDRLGTETGDDFGQTNTETKNGKTTHTMWIDDGQERVGTRFEGASDEEFLNAVGVHESSHKLNPDQVALDTKLAT